MRAPSSDQSRVLTLPCVRSFVKTVQFPDSGVITATWVNPLTRATNASVLPSGEIRGAAAPVGAFSRVAVHVDAVRSDLPQIARTKPTSAKTPHAPTHNA